MVILDTASLACRSRCCHHRCRARPRLLATWRGGFPSSAVVHGDAARWYDRGGHSTLSLGADADVVAWKRPRSRSARVIPRRGGGASVVIPETASLRTPQLLLSLSLLLESPSAGCSRNGFSSSAVLHGGAARWRCRGRASDDLLHGDVVGVKVTDWSFETGASRANRASLSNATRWYRRTVRELDHSYECATDYAGKERASRRGASCVLHCSCSVAASSLLDPEAQPDMSFITSCKFGVLVHPPSGGWTKTGELVQLTGFL